MLIWAGVDIVVADADDAWRCGTSGCRRLGNAMCVSENDDDEWCGQSSKQTTYIGKPVQGMALSFIDARVAEHAVFDKHDHRSYAFTQSTSPARTGPRKTRSYAGRQPWKGWLSRVGSNAETSTCERACELVRGWR